jgi:hypothetical protein
MALSVYFPKTVAIDNPRLWAVQCFCGCTTAIIVIWFLAFTKIGYIKTVLPDSLLTAMVVTPNITYLDASSIYWGGNANANDLQQRANAGKFSYSGETRKQGQLFTFANPSVAVGCNSLSATAFDISCLSQSDIYKHTKAETIEHVYLEDALFVPTAYNEEFYVPGKSAASIDCPLAGQLAPGTTECKSHKSWLVPGIDVEPLVEKQGNEWALQFFHHYAVIPPGSAYHDLLNVDRTIKGKLDVRVLDKDDNLFYQYTEDELVSLPIWALLEIAGIDLDSPLSTGSKQFPTNQLTQTNAALTPRVTGVEITVEMDYLSGMLPSIGPLCNVRVTGRPNWVGITESQVIDADGSMRTRTYSGIRIRFLRKGRFQYFNPEALIFSLTTFIVWIRIPAFIVFYFAVFCLGSLSKIYTSYLYQDLNLVNEFNGASARLLRRAHDFNDLHDLRDADGTCAMSYEEARRRMDYILEGRRELDEQEKEYFVSFFFSSSASKVGEKERLAIILDDFLQAVSAEETLQYDEILGIVDADRHKMGFLEKLFADRTLKSFVEGSRRLSQRRDAEDNAAIALGQPAVTDDAEPLETNAEPPETNAKALRLKRGASQAAVTALERQAALFGARLSAQKLALKLDGLTKDLDGCRRSRETLAERHNAYLHYLAHLQDQIFEYESLSAGTRRMNSVDFR